VESWWAALSECARLEEEMGWANARPRGKIHLARATLIVFG